MRPLRTIKELTSTIIKLIDHLNNTVIIVRKAMNLHDYHDNMKAIKKSLFTSLAHAMSIVMINWTLERHGSYFGKNISWSLSSSLSWLPASIVSYLFCKMGYSSRAKMENYQLELTEAKVNSLHFAKRKERGLVLMKGLIKCTQKLHIGVKCNAIVTVVLSSESLSKREVKNSSSFLYFSCCIY